MKNQRRYLRVAALMSLAWGASTFSSYANPEEYHLAVVKSEKEQKHSRAVRKAKSEEAKIGAGVTFEIGSPLGKKYPIKDSFLPSLILAKEAAKINYFDISVTVKLNASKKWIFDDMAFDTVAEVKLDTTSCKLSKIYLKWNEWTAGLTESTFGKISTFPAVKVEQISWKRNINEQFTVALGLEQAKTFSLYPSDKSKEEEKKDGSLKASKNLPAGSFSVRYNLLDKKSSFELSALARPLTWFDDSAKKPFSELGYGVNLGGKIHISPETDLLTVNFMAGQGIGEYVADLSGLGTEVVSVSINTNTTKKEAKPIFVGVAGATYKHHWIPTLYSTFGTGFTWLTDGGMTNLNQDTRAAEAYKGGLFVSGNLVYHFTEHTTFGIEYGGGLRNNVKKDRQDTDWVNHAKASFEFKI
jgi:hypothetical protein